MAVTANVDVYLDNFISVVQVGTKERHLMIWNLFNQIYKVFRPNEATDTDRKEPISLKKLGQGGWAWSTQKTVLGWNLDTVAQLLHPLLNQKAKVHAALKAIPKTSHTTSLPKWRKLLGLL